MLSRSPGAQGGRVVALNTINGHVRWGRDLPSRAESSPLLDKGKLFFGSQNGTVYALNARNGNVLWTYHASGAVKASPSLSGGVLYFGDYSGATSGRAASTTGISCGRAVPEGRCSEAAPSTRPRR